MLKPNNMFVHHLKYTTTTTKSEAVLRSTIVLRCPPYPPVPGGAGVAEPGDHEGVPRGQDLVVEVRTRPLQPSLEQDLWREKKQCTGWPICS